MKKALAVLMALCVVFCFCMPLSAMDMTHRIEEAGMDVTLPEDWVVYTRDTPANDPNIEIYYVGHAEMIAYMEKYDVYMEVLPDSEMMVGVKIWSVDRLGTDFRNVLSTEDKAERDRLFNDMIINAPAGDVTLLELYESNVGGDNNYLYLKNEVRTESYIVEQYVAVVGDKAVFVYGMPTDTYRLDAFNQGVLKQILKDIRYDNGTLIGATQSNKPIGGTDQPDQSTPSSSVAPSAPSKGTMDVRTIVLIALGALVLAGVAVAGVLLLRKKKPKSGMQEAANRAQPRVDAATSVQNNGAPAPMTPALQPVQQPVGQTTTVPAAPVQQEVRRKAFCGQCGEKLSETTKFCGNCGAKVE